ncbi:MAG: diguanylate cyclase [Moorellaceae bacterium]
MPSSPQKKVLIVEDSRLQARITAETLGEHGYLVDIALSPEEAWEKVLSPHSPDLILMDIDLGEEADGAALAGRIQQTKNVPVVFLTALSTREVVERVRSVARYGYVIKGAPEHVLVATVEMALELHEALSTAEMYRRIVEDSLTEVYIFHPESLKLLAVNRGARENLRYTGEELLAMTPMDIQPEFDRQSFGALLNPLLQGEKEKLVFETVHRRKDGTLYPVEVHLQLFGRGREAVCVAFIRDLTSRKKMEDKLRQQSEFLRLLLAALPVGVLKSVVAAFQARLRKTDCLARWGGEEFVILLPETALEGATVLAEELRRKLSEMEIPGVGRVTASFGVTGHRPGDTLDIVTQRVDTALYRAKGNGRNCVCVDNSLRS